MTTVPYIPAHPIPETYLNASYKVRSWLLTVDHKRIAIMYLVAVTTMLFLGGAFAMVLRVELLSPDKDIIEALTYNRMCTLHGLVMVFMHDRAGWSLITWIDVLIPNLVLIFVPSGLTAAAFWLTANRVRRD